MFPTFLLMLISLYLAQMGDKTQLLTLFLATKTKRHKMLFFAIMTGFIIGVALASLFGAGLSLIIPHNAIHIISGTIFIILGFFLFKDGKRKKERHKKIKMSHPFLTIAFITFFADFGDKTQIAIALFAADNNPLLVFLAAILALGLDTFLMIAFSKLILKKLDATIIERIAGILFILTGIFLLIQTRL